MKMREFTTTYIKRSKHRRRCLICGRLINDGEKVVASLIQEEKYYPIKGLMKFTSWKFIHLHCLKKGGE